MMTEIREKIEVAAVFGKTEKIRPVWFVWNREKVRVREITYQWTEKQGAEIHHRFSVTDGASLYEISYASGSLRWELVAVETQG